MIVIEIEDIKGFMSKLLTTDTFDKFHTGVCEVETFVAFSTDGYISKNWFKDEEIDDERATWGMLRPIFLQLVKGKKQPDKMKLNLCHRLKNNDIGSLRIEFIEGQLHIYTGYMQAEFSMNKDSQNEWDENCKKFIDKIAYA